MVIDCCHSGTMMDLKYNYVKKDNYQNVIKDDRYDDTIGEVYLISGCQDEQTSPWPS